MELEALQKKRKKMLLINLIYFIGLLLIGVSLFLTGAGRWIWVPAAAAVVFYLLLARPVKVNFERELRETILRRRVLSRLDEARYDRSEGISASHLTDAGFVNVINEKAYLSCEHICGKSGGMTVEMADVTFPIRENGLNKVFSGCLIHITAPGKDYAPLRVYGGNLDESSGSVTTRERELIKSLGSYIPGSLSLYREGQTLDVLLRGRFIGFPVNPLGEVRESTLQSDPLPELKTALELAALG